MLSHFYILRRSVNHYNKGHYTYRLRCSAGRLEVLVGGTDLEGPPVWYTGFVMHTRLVEESVKKIKRLKRTSDQVERVC